jgi:OOP family OmpA-OmpF porin
MIKGAHFTLLVALLCGLSPALAEEESSSGVLQIELLQQIETLQRHADIMALGERSANDYHLAKARAWLDLARGEYYENEGDGIVPAAIEQAAALLDALDKNRSDIGMDTPERITGSEAVRPDMWGKIASLKKHAKFFCGQRSIAEAEVQLVWAGHEKFESSWASAKSYADRAEDLLKQANKSIDDCAGPLPVIERITVLTTVALFDFDKANPGRPARMQLDRLVNSVKLATSLEGIDLVGHTDRLRSDGHPERNQLLSEKRAESIKRYLIEKGIPAEKIHASGAGSSQPIVKCSTRQSKAKQVECLQPNRRVEIILRTVK